MKEKTELFKAEDGLKRLNALAPEEAVAELLKCCGSVRWARALSAARPFQNVPELFEVADRLWWDLERGDWLEAFSCHPKIGEKRAARSVSSDARRWSEEEQRGARSASRETLSALTEANRAYWEKFGYIFIVCATGKSTEEMLALLIGRLSNDTDTELRIAAGEQRRITELRLKKLLAR